MLREAVDSARALTGTGYGVIAALDAAVAPRTLGVLGRDARGGAELVAWPATPACSSTCAASQGRCASSTSRATSAPAPSASSPRDAHAHLSGTPLRHRGAEVGHFYLAEKADGEAFTDEDEEEVILFASQAASTIANARTHRDASRRACAKRLVTDHGRSHDRGELSSKPRCPSPPSRRRRRRLAGESSRLL